MTFKPFLLNLDESNIPQQGSMANKLNVEERRPYRGSKRSDLAYVNQTVLRKNEETGEVGPTLEAKLVGHAGETTLFKDEWKYIDDTINTARKVKMNFINWLIEKGCVIDIPNGLSVTQYEWQNITDLEGADLSMDGLKQTDTDRVEYSSDAIPLPIISKNWRLNLRFLEESRRKGIPMDTKYAADSAHNVATFAETMMVQGTNGFKASGGTLYGLLDSPNVINLTAGTLFAKDWANPSCTGAEILADVQAMIRQLNANRRDGPFTLWLPNDYQTVLMNDYVANYPKTIYQRLMETGAISEIKYSAFFSKDASSKYRIALIEPSKECIAVIRGMEFRDFEWESLGGWAIDHKVAGIYVPLIRKDAGKESGIVRATLA